MINLLSAAEVVMIATFLRHICLLNHMGLITADPLLLALVKIVKEQV